LHRQLLGAENPKTLKTMSRLGRTAWLQGKYAEAETLLGRALEIERRVLGPDHPDTLYSMNNLATVYTSQGKYAQAEALDSQTLERRSTARPWRSSAAYWARNIPTRWWT
jgi:Flp pilus assembly protein TadD